MSKGSIALLVVLAALVVGGIFIHKARLKSASEAEAKQDAIALLQRNKVIEADWAYVSGLIEKHHPAAAAEAFKPGGLTAQDEFDADQYQSVLWKLVSDSAEADKKIEIVNALPGRGDRTLHKSPPPKREADDQEE
jgi:hypothetical protein